MPAFDREVKSMPGLPIDRTGANYGAAHGIAGHGMADSGRPSEAFPLVCCKAEARLKKIEFSMKE